MTSPPGTAMDGPGTITVLIDEVFRGAGPVQSAWTEGLTPGTALGRYDLIREVGRGGAGIVWEARDRELGRRVAVKVMRARHGALPEKRLIAEAEVAARLSHPGIVTILDVGRNDRGAWLVQEFLVGRPLADRLREGALPLRAALSIAVRTASALAYAHRHGVVHRDLTPANVFLCEDGQVKVLDLGMALAFGRRKLEGGTFNCMPPEQARGLPEDERVDVYALGVLLFWMVTGHRPFPAETPPERRLPPHLESPVLPGLGPLVDRMLAADPGARPRDAAAVLAELEELQAALPTTVTATSGGAIRVRRRWPRWAVASGIAAVIALTAGGAVAAARHLSGPRVARVEPIPFGAVTTSSSCQWGSASWTELDRDPPDAVVKNGQVGSQGVAEVGGRKAWRFMGDWGHLALPMGRAARGDPFAVEAEFFIPPVTTYMRGVTLVVFADPSGKPNAGESTHGISFGVSVEPDKAPYFDWHEPGPGGTVSRRYIGTLTDSPVGAWHTLRVEGSPSGKWYRGLLDGRPLVVARGDFDLTGARVILGAGYGYMNPEEVAWSNLRTFAGTGDCR